MARTWLSISSELIGGRGEVLWPRPGRIFAVGPAQPVDDFADSIITACSRTAVAHLTELTLAYGNRITGLYPYEDLAKASCVPVILNLGITRVKFVAPSNSANNSSLFSFSVIIGS